MAKDVEPTHNPANLQYRECALAMDVSKNVLTIGLCFFGTSCADAVYLSEDLISRAGVKIRRRETYRPPHVGKALTISAMDDPVTWFSG